MRAIILAAFVAAAIPAVACAQAAKTAPAAAAAAYNTTDYDLGTLIDNPTTKAVLDKHIPSMINSDQITMARGMTLRGLQQYAGDTLTDAKLAVIDAELAKIPVKK